MSAEARALSEVRFAWAELCGSIIDPRHSDQAISAVRGAVLIDAKFLYEILLKIDLNSAALQRV